jgi:hypothetical protein
MINIEPRALPAALLLLLTPLPFVLGGVCASEVTGGAAVLGTVTVVVTIVPAGKSGLDSSHEGSCVDL